MRRKAPGVLCPVLELLKWGKSRQTLGEGYCAAGLTILVQIVLVVAPQSDQDTRCPVQMKRPQRKTVCYVFPYKRREQGSKVEGESSESGYSGVLDGAP